MDLDNIEAIKKLDEKKVLISIETFSDQCLHAFSSTDNIEIPESYKNIKAVVMCGMGGSGLAARVIESVYAKDIKIPFIRVNDYDIPEFVNEDTLVICSSYSGETEETLSNFNQAVEKNAKIIVISAGNSLIRMAQEKGIPYYQIDPKYNTCNQPRMAIGYSVIGQLVMCSKAGLFDFSENDLETIVKVMKNVSEKINVDILSTNNEAKKVAKLMKDKIIFYVSGKHLVGAAHVVNNQTNENSKAFCTDFTIPELNHHLMEGLTHPVKEGVPLVAFFANSSLYEEKIAKRFAITKEVCEKQGVIVYEYVCKGETKIEQAFELMQFGVYVNFYLSMLYNQNPAPIPWVDYFKEKLGQPLGK